MFCENCGAKINENDVFCSNCGFNLGFNNIEQISNVKETIEYTHKKNKWVTLLLYFLPAIGWLGIYNIYAGRKKGFVQIAIWVFSIFISTIILKFNSLNFIISIISFIIFTLWIIDIVWVFKLPRKYYIENNTFYK